MAGPTPQQSTLSKFMPNASLTIQYLNGPDGLGGGYCHKGGGAEVMNVAVCTKYAAWYFRVYAMV